MGIIEKCYEDATLMERIDKAIEREIIRTGKTGSETVTVILKISDREREAFHRIKKYELENYMWEVDGNELIINYTEVLYL